MTAVHPRNHQVLEILLGPSISPWSLWSVHNPQPKVSFLEYLELNSNSVAVTCEASHSLTPAKLFNHIQLYPPPPHYVEDVFPLPLRCPTRCLGSLAQAISSTQITPSSDFCRNLTGPDHSAGIWYLETRLVGYDVPIFTYYVILR